MYPLRRCPRCRYCLRCRRLSSRHFPRRRRRCLRSRPPPPLLSLRIELVVAPLVPDFDRIDYGLWSRTQSLIAVPVRLTHSFGMSLRTVVPGGFAAVYGAAGLVVDCAFAVAAIAIVIAPMSNPCCHVFIVPPLVSNWRRCSPAYKRVIAPFM